MPIVEVCEIIKRPMALAWNQVKNLQQYPQFMDSVKAIDILSETPEETVSKWTVSLKDSLMQWTEKEHYLPEDNRINFEQIDGDLAAFAGYWQLKAISEDETEITLHIDFDIGIPTLDEILNPIAVEALEENSRAMLRSFNLH